MTHKATFGGRLRALRDKLGFSQAEMARKMGLAHNTLISRYENDKAIPTSESLVSLAKNCDIDLHWLITGIECGKIDHIRKILKPCAEVYLKQLGEKIGDINASMVGLSIAEAVRGEDHKDEIKKKQKMVSKLEDEFMKIKEIIS